VVLVSQGKETMVVVLEVHVAQAIVRVAAAEVLAELAVLVSPGPVVLIIPAELVVLA
jgi:hypothetical protein